MIALLKFLAPIGVAYWSEDVLTGVFREDGSPLPSTVKWAMVGLGVVGTIAIVRQVIK